MLVERGSLVKFHYTARFDKGELFVSSVGKEPVKYKVGEGRLIKGIEDGLVGMKKSEKKEIVVPPDKGYGRRDKDLVRKVNKNILPDSNLEIGQVIETRNKERNVRTAKVLAVEADTVTLDFNHPLAGKTLKFDIEVVEIH